MIAALSVPQITSGAGELAYEPQTSPLAPTRRTGARFAFPTEPQTSGLENIVPAVASRPFRPVANIVAPAETSLPAEASLSARAEVFDVEGPVETEQMIADGGLDRLSTLDTNAINPSGANPTLFSSVEYGQTNLSMTDSTAGTADPSIVVFSSTTNVALAMVEPNATAFLETVEAALTVGQQGGNPSIAELPTAVSSPLPKRDDIAPSVAEANLAKIASLSSTKMSQTPIVAAPAERANVPVVTNSGPLLAALPSAVAEASGDTQPSGQASNLLALPEIKSQLATRIDGKTAGKVDFQQMSTGLAVRVGSLVELLGERYEPAEINRIRESAAKDIYLPLSQLQAAGIPITYDPVYDEFNVGLVDTRPKAARKVHMDQISTPERGLSSTGIDQVRR